MSGFNRMKLSILFLGASAAFAHAGFAQTTGAEVKKEQMGPPAGEVKPQQPTAALAEEFEIPKITPGPEMTIAEALRAADKRNLTLEAARAEIEKTEAKLSQAWALVLPAAQSKLQLMHRDHEDSVNFGGTDLVIMPQQDLKGIVEAGMPLINAQSWLTISAAKKGVELARMSVEQGRQQLLLGVAQAYYMALMAESLIGLYETQVNSSEHHRQVAAARFEAGTGLRIDVIRAETDLYEARQKLLSAHLSFDNARDAIGVLTGSSGLPMPVEAPPMNSPSGDEAELAKRALAQRPDLKSKNLNMELMRKQLDASWMQFVPTLDAAWQFQYQFTKPSELGSTDRSRWTLLFTLSVPIYNHFRYGDLDEKRAALRQAMIQQKDAEENASMSVRKTRRDYLTALSSVAIAERQAILAKEALTLVEASYNAGTGSSLDITDGRRTASSAEVNWAAKRLEAQVALLSLLNAIGEDVSTFAK